VILPCSVGKTDGIVEQVDKADFNLSGSHLTRKGISFKIQHNLLVFRIRQVLDFVIGRRQHLLHRQHQPVHDHLTGTQHVHVGSWQSTSARICMAALSTCLA